MYDKIIYIDTGAFLICSDHVISELDPKLKQGLPAYIPALYKIILLKDLKTQYRPLHNKPSKIFIIIKLVPKN